MRAELTQDNIKVAGLSVSIEDAKEFLRANYPALLDAFVVKREITSRGEIRHVDWQGCMLHPLVKAVIHGYFAKKSRP